MKTINTKQKLFEMMQKVNPDFVIKEVAPAPTPLTPDRRSPSFIDDNTLSVGELKAAIYIYSNAKTKDDALAAAKSLSVDISKCVVGLIGVAGFIAGTVGSGGLLAAVAGGVVAGGAGAASTGHDVMNVFKRLLGPKTKSAPKTPTGFMQLLNIDSEVSVLLDDRIENEFIQFAVTKLNSMQDTEPVPNFFNELRGFIKEKYAQVYNIAYGQTPPAQ
jgi:hypothetical protein